MQDTDRSLAAAIVSETTRWLNDCVGKIEHCLGQLTDEQVWWRPDEQMNAIGNLILHLCGNLGQWIISGIGGAVDVRNRPHEFSERRRIPRAELLERLREKAQEATEALSALTGDDMLKVRRIQGFATSGLGAIFRFLPHFKGHTQEIICLTRLQLGDKYKFHWVPATVEQGAAVSQ